MLTLIITQLILAILLVILVLLQGSDNEGLGLGGGLLPGLTRRAPGRSLSVFHKARGQRPFTVARLDGALT